MKSESVVQNKRNILYDKPIKLVLLTFHFLGFCVWYGGVILNIEPATIFPVVAVASGALLTIRELYKDGLRWLSVTEGVLTWTKVLLLFVIYLIGNYELILLSLVMLFGLLSSHLPDEIREKRLFSKL